MTLSPIDFGEQAGDRPTKPASKTTTKDGSKPVFFRSVFIKTSQLEVNIGRNLKSLIVI
jgi:hypothetical protein